MPKGNPVGRVGSTPTRFRQVYLEERALRKIEAAKGGIKGNAFGFWVRFFGGTSDDRIYSCPNVVRLTFVARSAEVPSRCTAHPSSPLIPENLIDRRVYVHAVILSEKIALLNINKQRVTNAPSFEKDNWPNMTDTTWPLKFTASAGASLIARDETQSGGSSTEKSIRANVEAPAIGDFTTEEKGTEK